MSIQLKIHIDSSISDNKIIRNYFQTEFYKIIEILFNGEVKGTFTGECTEANLVLCNAESNKPFENVLPIVIDNKISQTYQDINSFPLPDKNGNDYECKQLAQNLTFAILSRLGIGNFHSRIFISYRRQDREALALDLFKRLSSDSLGFDVFLDTRKLDVGCKFMDDIRLSIAESDVFLFLDSKGYWDSLYTKKELFSAMSSCTGIIRVYSKDESDDLENVRVTNKFESFSIEKHNCIADDEFNDLITTISRLRISFLRLKIERINNFNKANKEKRESLWSFMFDKTRICPIWGIPSSQRIEYLEKRIKNITHETSDFSILYDHWNVPYSYNEHIHWIVKEKNNINIKTLKTLKMNQFVETGQEPVVFLSASLPSGDDTINYDKDYDFTKVYNIIITLVEAVIIRNGILVFGGHPTITPIIANMMNTQYATDKKKGYPNIHLYQSAFFEKEERPIENLEFPDNNIHVVEAGEDIKKSLEVMRRAMLVKPEKGKPFTLGVFIGGKVKKDENGKLSCGVWDEFELFHKEYSNAKCVAFKNTGTNIGKLNELYGRTEGEGVEISMQEFIKILYQ